jgi:hypothetical protein
MHAATDDGVSDRHDGGAPGVPVANCTGRDYWTLITATGTMSPTALNEQ